MGSPLYVLSLASRQAQWLGARQQVIAGNVANANTPGFRASDVKPFAENLDRTAATVAVTDPRHISPDGSGTANVGRRTVDGWETSASGNSVSLEAEMMKAGEVHRAFALNTSIVKALDRMILMSVKGGQ